MSFKVQGKKCKQKNQKSEFLIDVFSSVAQSCPTLWDPMNHSTPGLCPSPTPRVYPNPCPSSRWCHRIISCSVVPFSSCPQSFPVSGSFQMSPLFASSSQSIGVSASTSVFPMNSQEWSLRRSINSSALSFLYSPRGRRASDTTEGLNWTEHL